MELELAGVGVTAREFDMIAGRQVPYSGGKDRKSDRRMKRERREMLRFELEKEPRRRNRDRRNDSAWDGRHEN